MESENLDGFSEFSRFPMDSNLRGGSFYSGARICSRYGFLHKFQSGANHQQNPGKISPSSHNMNGFSSR